MVKLLLEPTWWEQKQIATEIDIPGRVNDPPGKHGLLDYTKKADTEGADRS